MSAFFFVSHHDSPTDESGPWTSGLLISRYPSSSGSLDMETFGSPKFPSYPLKSMPWSQTPVVTSTLAMAIKVCCLPRAPGRRLSPAFTGLSNDHNYTIFGLNTEPGFLLRPASYSGCPACTWTSLPSGWLTFARVGLSHLRSPTG